MKRRKENDIILGTFLAGIILTNRKGKPKAMAIIDLHNVDKVRGVRWFLDGKGYVDSKERGKLHRYLMRYPEDKDVDHRNCKPLDNRECNLRVCTNYQNNLNKGVKSNNTSGMTGLYYHREKKSWRAYINVNHQRIELGYRKDKNAAIKLRKDAEIKYFGEFAYCS